MKKVIDVGRVWTCENLDSLSPINWEGWNVLFSDGLTQVVDSLDEIKNYEKATKEEVKDFYRQRNFIFVGDEIEIIKGRKLPIGEIKIVKSFYTYTVNGTYGHDTTKYVVFTDGTKTAIQNVRNVKAIGQEYPIEFKQGYNLSGRL